MKALEHYQLLAGLFRYPDLNFRKTVKNIQEQIKGSYTDAADAIACFLKSIPQADLDQLQSLFTRTFDIQAVTTLDIAYVLFGDDYKRGEILSNLNREHVKVKNDCGVELADHLPNLLCLIAKLEDKELISDLVRIILGPALQKMLSEFNPESLKQKNKLYKKHYKTLIEVPCKNNLAYFHALQALYRVIQKDFNLHETKQKDYAGNDFLNSVSAELDIEKVAHE